MPSPSSQACQAPPGVPKSPAQPSPDCSGFAGTFLSHLSREGSRSLPGREAEQEQTCHSSVIGAGEWGGETSPVPCSASQLSRAASFPGLCISREQPTAAALLAHLRGLPCIIPIFLSFVSFFLFFLLFPCLFTCLITAGFEEGQDVTSQMLSQTPVSLLNHELLLLDVILSSVHSLLSCIQPDPSVCWDIVLMKHWAFYRC